MLHLPQRHFDTFCLENWVKVQWTIFITTEWIHVESCLYVDSQSEQYQSMLGHWQWSSWWHHVWAYKPAKILPMRVNVFLVGDVQGHWYFCVLSLLLLSFYLHIHLVPRAGSAETANFLCSHNTNQIYFSFEASYIWFWYKTFHRVMNYFYKSRTMSCLSGLSAGQ